MSSDSQPAMFLPRLPSQSRNRTLSQDLRYLELQTSENRKSRLPKTRSADFRKSDGSYIKSNQTESSYTDLSIHLSPSTQNRGLIDRYDRYDCREEIESQIDFLGLCRQYAQEDVDGIIELMVDTLCSVHPSIRIGGEPIPINQVRSRFLSLERKHIEYVFDSLKRNTTKVRNIRAYLLTALYNAPITINQYYQAEVQHDFGA